MALAGRSSRSGGGRRLLIVALVVTLIAVLIDASLKSRSPAPAQTLDGQAWVDRVMPVIASSNSEGREIAKLRSSAIGMQAGAITSALNGIAAAAGRDYRSVESLGSPSAVGGAPGLLEACMQVRAQGAAAMASAMQAALAAPPPTVPSDPHVAAIAAAAQDFQIADRAYKLFSSDLPKSLGVAVPASAWVPDPGQYDPGNLQVFLAAVRNSTSSSPVHQITIQAVSTNPPPVGAQNGVQQLPAARQLGVTIVVADTGNQPEANLTVTASLSPSAYTSASSVRDFISLTPGSSRALSIGPLSPAQGVPATLTVTVTPLAGSSTPTATSKLAIEVNAPPPPSTTTTVPQARSGSQGGKGSGQSSPSTTTGRG